MAKRLNNLRGNITRIALITLIIGIITTIIGTTFELKVYANNKFKDVKLTDWYYEDVTAVANQDIIKGYPDETFKPESTVTYAEYITMVVKSYLGSDPGNSTEGHWASNYYDKGIEKGLFTPYDVPQYQLDQEIPREIMAVIMSNAIGGKEIEDYNIIQSTIKDMMPLSNNMYHITQSYGYGILTGYPDGTFKPGQTLTRGESATVIRRYLDPSRRKKPDIAKIKEELEKEKNAESYWMNDPEYDELVAWIEDNIPPRYKNSGWVTGNEEETRIASYSPEFHLKNGRFTVISQGLGTYTEHQIQNNDKYPKIHEHVYKTFKILKDLAEKHNLYLTMSSSDVTDGIEIYLETSYINYDSTMFMFRFSNAPLDWNVINGQRVDVEVLPYIEFMQGGYAAKEFINLEDWIEKKGIGNSDYPDTVRNIFKMLYGEDSGNKIADYTMKMFEDRYDEEKRVKVDLPYEKQTLNSYNISYDEEFDGHQRFNIDRP